MYLTPSRLLVTLAIVAASLGGSADAFTFNFRSATCNTLSYSLRLIPQEVNQGTSVDIQLFYSSASRSPDARNTFPIAGTFRPNALTAQLSTQFYTATQSYPSAFIVISILDAQGNQIVYPGSTTADTENDSTPITCNGPASSSSSSSSTSSSSTSALPTPTTSSSSSTLTSSTSSSTRSSSRTSSSSSTASRTTNAIATSSATQGSSSSGSNTGAIAGGVVGGIVGLALLGLAIFFCLRKRREREDDYTNGMPYNGMDGAVGTSGTGGGAGEMEQSSEHPYVSGMTYNNAGVGATAGAAGVGAAGAAAVSSGHAGYDANQHEYDQQQYYQDPSQGHQQYYQDPSQQYYQDPSQGHQQYYQDPSQQYHQDPSQQYYQDPAQAYPQQQQYYDDGSAAVQADMYAQNQQLHNPHMPPYGVAPPHH